MADSIENFVAEARAYCRFIEVAGSLSLGERLAAARVRLLALYAAGVALPSEPEPGAVAAGPSPAPPTSWQGFGAHEHYSEVFDPYVPENPVGASLSDDLLDVYSDVGRGLELWDTSHATEAIWEWRFAFDSHWGDHAIDALRALHRACKSA